MFEHETEVRFPVRDRSVRRMKAKQVPISSKVPNFLLRDRLTRARDLVIASALVVLTFPLVIFVCLAIKLESAGPAFHRQLRLARNGRRFFALKFRTTVYDPERTSRPIGDRDGPETSVGQFLRYTRIENLPRLINVLRGEMTMIDGDAHSPSFLD
jgi:lipopolysaccharide/colanic/teichoic acid biosynthesis glycosyltransferase